MARQRVQFLEKKLNEELEQPRKRRAWREGKSAAAKQLSTDLAEADKKHKYLVAQLRCAVCTEPEDPETPAAGLRLRDILDGKLSTLQFVDADDVFAMPGDEYEVTNTDKVELDKRTRELQSNIANAVQQAVGGIVAQIDTIKEQHASRLSRLARKKRKTGEEGEAAPW